MVPTNRQPLTSPSLAWVAALFVGFIWAYWPTLGTMISRWSADAQYTHGYVVPLFAALVLWLRRDRMPPADCSWSWIGVALVALAGSGRLLGSLFAFEWLEVGSILPAMIGIIWLVFGPGIVRWAWPAAVLMLFILPWPWQLDQLLTYPLRRLATLCSTFALQTVGVPALARGNIIIINDAPPIGVVEACSGLGMMMTFFALSTAVAFAVERPRLDKAIIFFSAIPIALIMNVLRITVTVFLFQFASADIAKLVFHDVAGWVMMPMALLALWSLVRVLDSTWLPPEDLRPVPLMRPRFVPIAEPSPTIEETTDAAH